MKDFKSLPELMSSIPDEKAARTFMEKVLWGDTPMCPHCYNKGGYKLKDGKTYKCKNPKCKRTFTVTVKSIFERTHVPLTKWVYAIYLCSVHKRGISSYQLAEDIGVTQKTAWFMLHRIRKLFIDKGYDMLYGEVEIDETFVGGKNKNRHKDKKVERAHGRSYLDKTPVVGMLERGGRLAAFVTRDTSQDSLSVLVRNNIQEGSIVYTDEWRGYSDLHFRYQHEQVYHSRRQYVNGDASTNAIENFWSHLKRAIIGVYYKVSRKHLQRYVDELVYKFNVRNLSVQEKMVTAMVNCRSRLMYKDLVFSP